MRFQSEVWRILQDEEENQVWDRFYSEFCFKASMHDMSPPFQFQIPVDCYDISRSPIWKDDEAINKMIQSAFITCMDNDDFMYALDCHHTCFRYNPRINSSIEYPVFIHDERYMHGGYNVYFPEFYPNGDYYFFLAKDFRWGYLSHPWQEKVWIFGEELMKTFREHADEIGFIPCTG